MFGGRIVGTGIKTTGGINAAYAILVDDELLLDSLNRMHLALLNATSNRGGSTGLAAALRDIRQILRERNRNRTVVFVRGLGA